MSLVPARRADAQRIQRPRGPTRLPPAPAATGTALIRLVQRITMGLSQAEVDRVKALGYTKYLNYQLDYENIDDTAVEQLVAQRYPALAQNC